MVNLIDSLEEHQEHQEPLVDLSSLLFAICWRLILNETFGKILYCVYLGT